MLEELYRGKAHFYLTWVDFQNADLNKLHTFTSGGFQYDHSRSSSTPTEESGLRILLKGTSACVEWSGVSVWGPPGPYRKQHENRKSNRS